MTIALDQNLGTGGADTSASTVVLTTANAAASGTFIVLYVTWFTDGTLTLNGVSDDSAGGPLGWNIDLKQNPSSPACGLAIVSAQAPSGLASGTNITATYSGTIVGARFIAGDSWTGVATSSPVDGTPPAEHTDANTAWASNSYTIGNAGSLLVAVALETANVFTSTPTSPAVELHDFGAGGAGATAAYRLPGSTGTFTVAGTWSGDAGTGNSGTIAVAYLPGTGGGGGTTLNLACIN